MSSEIAISVKNLTKTYRIFGHPGDRIKQALTFGKKRFHKEFTALRDVSFEIKKGETVGIIGRNGSGKSTLLQLICGILKPTYGSVNVNGRVSALLELGAGFNPEFTGRENVYFQGAIMGLSETQIDEKFEEISAFAEIGEFIDQPVRTYSSGMYVRLAFAVAINVDADILVVDEALAVGDEAFQKKCFDKLTDYLSGEGKVLILVSHNIRQIERVCSSVIWLDDGRVLQMGQGDEICNAYQSKVHEYIQMSQNSLEPRPDIANSGELDVDRIRIFGSQSGDPVDAIEIHSSMRVVVDFCCHQNLIEPDIIVGFHSVDSVYIAASSAVEQGEAINFSVGKHHVECRFPNIILLPGVYQIRLVFFDRYRRHIWAGHRLCTFRVLAATSNNSMRIPLGLVDMPSEWSISSSDA